MEIRPSRMRLVSVPGLMRSWVDREGKAEVSQMKFPNVILLNGAPSAGKTQLTMALLARLPFVCMGIDEFIWQRVPASWYPAFAEFLGGPPNVGVSMGTNRRSYFAPFTERCGCVWTRDSVSWWTIVLSGATSSMTGCAPLTGSTSFSSAHIAWRRNWSFANVLGGIALSAQLWPQ